MLSHFAQLFLLIPAHRLTISRILSDWLEKHPEEKKLAKESALERLHRYQMKSRTNKDDHEITENVLIREDNYR